MVNPLAVDLDLSSLRAFVDEGPTPLFATVSGAHLYGFSSPDSDVDLRGAFVLSLDERLRLAPPPSTVTLMDHDSVPELDWVAHDIQKFATLMTKRNGYVLEQLFSPLVVFGGAWHEELIEIGRGCIVRHLHHHYRGFGAGKQRDLSKVDATVKDLLYSYRVYLTGITVLETGDICSHLPTLLEQHPADGVAALLERKRTGMEKAQLEPGEADAHRPRLAALEARLATAFDESALPDEPTTLSALSDFVVRACKKLGA